MSGYPYERNNDEDRQGIAATGYHIGEADDEIVIALSAPQFPMDIGVFLDREQAFEFLGRLSHEIAAKGWVS